MNLEELKELGEAPEWLSHQGYETLKRGYLLEGETPLDMYSRISAAAASRLNLPELEKDFFNAIWNNWICPSTPICANMGTDRGLPISCNTIHVGDDLYSIGSKNLELMILSKYGAGVGIYLGDLRGRGAPVKGTGGISDGISAWSKIFDSSVHSVNQGNTRRGAGAVYLPIGHSDIEEFLQMRRPTGDMNKRCLNLNHGVCIDDKFMNDILNGDEEKRKLWGKILTERVETGEPYLFFTDNVNRQRPECYVKNDLKIVSSNICCLSGDTLVATKNGPVRIDNLVGKTVEIYDGNLWVKNNSFKHRGDDELIRLHLKDGSHVDSNANHRWFVANNYSEIRDGKYTETRTSELKVGTWLQSISLEIHGKVDAEGGYIKGFLIGDGTSTKGRPLLRLHSTKYSCQDYLIESLREIKVGKVETTVISDPTFSKEYDFSKNSSAFGAQILKNLKGLSCRKGDLIKWATDYKKFLPQEVFKWNKKTKLSFLAGLFDADGTIGKKKCSLQISSIHLKFIQDLQLLIKTFGMSANIDKLERQEIGMKTSYRLTLSSFDSFNLLSELPCKRLKFQGVQPNRKLTGWRCITKIEKLEGIHKVYCPVLPTTGKFALANGLMTGNTEIFQYTDPEHTFVCGLLSMNLARYDEWKNTNAVELATFLLDAVIEEYIEKAKNIPGFECAVRSAIKGRAIGIGALGWHSLLQSKMIPFDSFDAMMLNAEIFGKIRSCAERASSKLANLLGEPEWCKGLSRRNSLLMAVAPTVSNSSISGGLSPGIEPWAANFFVEKSAKGTFIKKNPELVKLLEGKNQNSEDVWSQIGKDGGSVQGLSFLTDEEKKVFLTAREINQFAIIKQAAQRQKWIDQGQSVNLFFGLNADPSYIHQVHLEAWRLGLKSLYYCRTESILRADLATRQKDECEACSG